MRTNYNRHLEKNPRQNFFFPDTTSKILYKKIAFAMVITSPRGEKKKKKKKHIYDFEIVMVVMMM
jgi:hypothetical protein